MPAVPSTSDLAVTRRRRALGERLAPAGILWIDTAGLTHPEAARASRLPFLFLVGRTGSPARTARERDLALAAIEATAGDPARDLLDYARFVISTAPTAHARLTGRTATTWTTSRSRR